MDPSIAPITGKYNEDRVKFANMGKPLTLDHAARHPRPHDPISEHLKDYRDMLYDHHHDIPNTIRYALKGAFAAAIFGFLGGTRVLRPNSLAIRKISNYLKDDTFGRVKYNKSFS